MIINQKYRTITEEDIDDILAIRLSVKENRLSDPDSITRHMCLHHQTYLGQGWLCEIENKVVGFCYVDSTKRSIWALFVLPDYENQGIGKQLLTLACDWLFDRNTQPIVLNTEVNTRAEKFYRHLGWQGCSINDDNEVQLTLEYHNH